MTLAIAGRLNLSAIAAVRLFPDRHVMDREAWGAKQAECVMKRTIKSAPMKTITAPHEVQAFWKLSNSPSLASR
jgi:hypothetical protein